MAAWWDPPSEEPTSEQHRKQRNDRTVIIVISKLREGEGCMRTRTHMSTHAHACAHTLVCTMEESPPLECGFWQVRRFLLARCVLGRSTGTPTVAACAASDGETTVRARGRSRNKTLQVCDWPVKTAHTAWGPRGGGLPPTGLLGWPWGTWSQHVQARRLCTGAKTAHTGDRAGQWHGGGPRPGFSPRGAPPAGGLQM